MVRGGNTQGPSAQTLSRRQASQSFWVGLARAFGGAIIFALPLMMTMEMWWLGFYIAPLRLALLLFITLPLLVGLSYFSGFEATSCWRDGIVDAFVHMVLALWHRRSFYYSWPYLIPQCRLWK